MIVMNEQDIEDQNEKIRKGFKNIQRGFILGPVDKRNMIAIELSEYRIGLLVGILDDVKRFLDKQDHLSTDATDKLDLLFHVIRQLKDPIALEHTNIEHTIELHKLQIDDRLSGLENQLNKIKEVNDTIGMVVSMIHNKLWGVEDEQTRD